MLVRSPTRLTALAAPGAILLALGLRFSFVRDHGSDLPFHDQWDAEALHLLRPWKGGGDLTPYLLRFHNEHHPVLTKMITLGLAACDGMWSALPQLVLNTLFQGAIVWLISRLARRHLAAMTAWLMTVVAALALSLPLLWENMLWGFQSQFYLALLLGLLHLELTWSVPRLGWRWLVGVAAGILTLGTFAAGFLSVLAGGLVALTRLRQAGPARTHAVATGAVAAIISVPGFSLINPVPYSAVAHDSYSALEAFSVLGSWPFNLPVAALLVQLPVLVVFTGQALRDGERPSQPWLLSLLLWLLAVTAAFAFGRAELINGATPRYRDFLTVQCLVGAIALLQFAGAQAARRRAVWLAAGAWSLVTASGFVLALHGENLAREIAARVSVQSAQRELVRNFIQTDDPRVLEDSEATRLIHDSAAQRLSLLRDKGIRSLLPPSVRLPVATVAAAEPHDVTRRPFSPSDLLSPGWSLAPTADHAASFRSEPLDPQPFPILRFRVSGGVDGKDHRLILRAAPGGAAIEPLADTHGSGGQYINFPMPAGAFRVEADAAAGSPSLDFSDPVGFSRLSWLSGKILASHSFFTVAGIILLGLAGFGARSIASIAIPGRPASPGGMQLLAALSAIGFAAAGLLGWPKPLAFRADSRARLLLDPAAWSAHAAAGFYLSPVAPDDGAVNAGLVYAAVVSPESYFGTYGTEGDAHTARARSSTFALDADWLCVPIIGYPASPGDMLAVDVLNEHEETLETFKYSGANPGERPQLWTVDISAVKGRRARMRCVDGEVGHQGWLGFSTPWLLDQGSIAPSWQRMSDSNRLQWLRCSLLLASVAAALAWVRCSRRPVDAEAHPPLLWP